MNAPYSTEELIHVTDLTPNTLYFARLPIYIQ
jgi:hypothetical protein